MPIICQTKPLINESPKIIAIQLTITLPKTLGSLLSKVIHMIQLIKYSYSETIHMNSYDLILFLESHLLVLISNDIIN